MFPLLFLLLPHFPPTFPQNLCSDEGLCCSRRSNDCVVQKILSNHSLDLSHKPCYCDQACTNMADCCVDYHQYCGHQGKTRNIHRTSVTDRKLAHGHTFSRPSCLEMIVIRSSLSCSLLPHQLRPGSSICVSCWDCATLLTHTVHKFRIHRHCHGKMAVSLPSHGKNTNTLPSHGKNTNTLTSHGKNYPKNTGYELVIAGKNKGAVMAEQRDDFLMKRSGDDVDIGDFVMTKNKDEIGRDESEQRDYNEKEEMSRRSLRMTVAPRKDDCSCSHERQFIIL